MYMCMLKLKGVCVRVYVFSCIQRTTREEKNGI